MIERDRLFLAHIVEAIQRIERFTADGRAAFLANSRASAKRA